MNITLKTLIWLMISATIFSCKDRVAEKQKIEYDKLFKEVMRVHDEVMPETSNLYKLKKYAQENIDVLPKDNEFVEQLIETKIATEKADDAMMDWMAAFKVPESTHAEKMEYLNKELISITEVSKLMLSTLEKGKAVVRKSDKFIKENNLNPNAKGTVFRPVSK